MKMTERYKTLKDNCVKWIREYFDAQSKTAGVTLKAVIGMSGGKDSTVVAGLCKEALGADRVHCLVIPNGDKSLQDEHIAFKVMQSLGIKNYRIIDISNGYYCLTNEFRPKIDYENKTAAFINLVPRLRTDMLYFEAASIGGRVVGTGNLCERKLGWFTLWGDGSCDMNPIGNMLVSDVINVGLELGIPSEFVYRTPSDGLTGKSDEENLGFTYDQVEAVIRNDANSSVLTAVAIKQILERFAKMSWKKEMTNIPTFDDEILNYINR